MLGGTQVSILRSVAPVKQHVGCKQRTHCQECIPCHVAQAQPAGSLHRTQTLTCFLAERLAEILHLVSCACQIAYEVQAVLSLPKLHLLPLLNTFSAQALAPLAPKETRLQQDYMGGRGEGGMRCDVANCSTLFAMASCRPSYVKAAVLTCWQRLYLMAINMLTPSAWLVLYSNSKFKT